MRIGEINPSIRVPSSCVSVTIFRQAILRILVSTVGLALLWNSIWRPEIIQAAPQDSLSEDAHSISFRKTWFRPENADEIRNQNQLASTALLSQVGQKRTGIEICPSPIRIMPLGDSITVGSYSGEADSTKFISYRKDLWDNLNNAGFNVDFVGGQNNGEFYPDFDGDHEGYGGRTDLQLAGQMYQFLVANPAEVLLLHIGTNARNDADPKYVKGILDEIDRYEADFHREITVILARIINRIAQHDLTSQYNENVAAMAEGRIAKGDKIVIVDMEFGAGLIYIGQPDGDMWDNLHPYSTGYAKMAAVWFGALKKILPTCAVDPPEPYVLYVPYNASQ